MHAADASTSNATNVTFELVVGVYGFVKPATVAVVARDCL
jgi:hypothetical protein